MVFAHLTLKYGSQVGKSIGVRWGNILGRLEEQTPLVIDNPIENDNVEENINKKNKEEDVPFDSKKIISQDEENYDNDNSQHISEEKLPREVKNLAINVVRDHAPVVRNEVQLESSSCGRKRWQTKKIWILKYYLNCDADYQSVCV